MNSRIPERILEIITEENFEEIAQKSLGKSQKKHPKMSQKDFLEENQNNYLEVPEAFPEQRSHKKLIPEFQNDHQ